MINKILYFFTFLFCFHSTQAQFYGTESLQNRNFDLGIKSVKLTQAQDPFSYPVINLGQRRGLLLSFDDLEEGRSLAYTLVHCNSDWTPSNLDISEYLIGFEQESLDNFEFSFNTFTDYVHYELLFPNTDMGVSISGNFVLQVYDEDTEVLLFSRRFMVVEPLVDVQAIFQKPSNIQLIDSNHEFDFNVLHPRLQISNPRNSVKATVLQNGRWDNAVEGLQPVFIKKDLLEFDYQNKVSFKAGKEFRRVDLRNLKIPPKHIAQIEVGLEGIIAYRTSEKRRSNLAYFENQDLNGRFILDADDRNNSTTASEYIQTIFTLESHYQRTESDLFIFGELTNWKILPEAKMYYDKELKAYLGEMMLKQGFYNYYYVEVPYSENEDTAVIDWTEGSWYEAEDDYLILIYFRPFGGRYDKIIAYQRINSRDW